MKALTALISSLLAVACAQSSSPTSSATSRSNTTSSATTAAGPAVTTLAPSSSQGISLAAPPLIQCSYVTFSFSNAPNSSKVVSFFVDGASTFIEQFALDPSYDQLQLGTFAWRVDVPVGLAVHAQINAVRTNPDGSHTPESATSPTLVVQAGTDSSCLAQNVGQNTQSILSAASSLDPAFRWSGVAGPTATSASNNAGGSSTNTDAIAGAVVGGIAAICLVAICFFWLRHKHRKQRLILESQSLYGGNTEKGATAPYSNGSVLNFPHGHVPGTVLNFDEYGRPLETVQYTPDGFPLAPGQEAPAPQAKTTAPMGTLPEPMDADDDGGNRPQPTVVSDTSHAAASGHSPTTPRRGPGEAGDPFTPTTVHQPMSPLGSDGLADPSSFSPHRR